MNILSIQAGHNATVGIIQDGQVMGLLSQEKADNIKNSANFPLPATAMLLNEFNLQWTDIDEIAFANTEMYPSYCYVYNKNKPQRKYSCKEIIKSLERGLTEQYIPSVFKVMRMIQNCPWSLFIREIMLGFVHPVIPLLCLVESGGQ